MAPPRQISELESVLVMMIDEHRKLLAQVDAQQASMKALKVDAMQDAMHRQEGSRVRIGNLESRRRLLVQQIAKLSRLSPDATLPQIVVLYPQSATKLLGLRDELKQLMRQIADRTHVAGRLASAVLGHLNTALRLFAGAVGQAGTYTKNGIPRMTQRIGVMEAVG